MKKVVKFALLVLFCAITYVVARAQNQDDKRDKGFFYLSLNKTILGPSGRNEIFAINTKFNYFDLIVDKEDSLRIFALLEAELTLPADSTSKLLHSSLFTINAYVSNREKYYRKTYAGVGAKMFAGNLYFGPHLGSIETGRHYEDSYILGGFYFAPYRSASPEIDFHVCNFLVQISFGASNKNTSGDTQSLKIPVILKALRLKIEYLQPLFEKGLTIQDTQLRVTLVVPLGGIFEFP